MPPPWNLEGPSHPEEEEKLINISLGYGVPPLCLGPTELCINISRQTWAFVLPPQKEHPHIAWIIYCPCYSYRKFTIQ